MKFVRRDSQQVGNKQNYAISAEGEFMVRQTSLMAYREEQDNGNLGRMEQLVYEGLKLYGPCTDKELTELLGFKEANKVRPRRNKLVEKGIVVGCGKRQCKVSSKLATLWMIK